MSCERFLRPRNLADLTDKVNLNFIFSTVCVNKKMQLVECVRRSIRTKWLFCLHALIFVLQRSKLINTKLEYALEAKYIDLFSRDH